MTTTGWYPIVPVMKSPGSTRSSVSPNHTQDRPNTRTISRSNNSWSYTSHGWTKSVGSGDRTRLRPSATPDWIPRQDIGLRGHGLLLSDPPGVGTDTSRRVNSQPAGQLHSLVGRRGRHRRHGLVASMRQATWCTMTPGTEGAIAGAAREAPMALREDVQAILERGVQCRRRRGGGGPGRHNRRRARRCGCGAALSRRCGRRRPHDASTLCAGSPSMTKAITSTAAMQLVERERAPPRHPGVGRAAPPGRGGACSRGSTTTARPQVRPCPQADHPAPPADPHRRISATGSGMSRCCATSSPSTGPRSPAASCATMTVPALFDPGERWLYGINLDFVGLMV